MDRSMAALAGLADHLQLSAVSSFGLSIVTKENRFTLLK